MELESESQQATTHKIEAERRKLELEAREIERRLNARWWQGSGIPQYAIALAITVALLFGWARVYLEPILRRENEINTLAERRNKVQNDFLDASYRKLDADHKKLDADNKRITEEQQRLKGERDRLQAEYERQGKDKAALSDEAGRLKIDRARLLTERDSLQKERDELARDTALLKAGQIRLRSVLASLSRGIEDLVNGKAKYFFPPIYNLDDPVYMLNKYGWKTWTDNRFSQLGYYVVMQHPQVNSGKSIVVSRLPDIENLKESRADTWRKYMDDITREFPVLVLDYTYFRLYSNETASTGGVLYRQGDTDINFHAPLSEWSEKLKPILGQQR